MKIEITNLTVIDNNLIFAGYLTLSNKLKGENNQAK